jgi:hypothetical protein
MKVASNVLLAFVVLFGVGGCTVHEEMARAPSGQTIGFPRVTIDGRSAYLVEGDLLFDKQALKAYEMQRHKTSGAPAVATVAKTSVPTDGILTVSGNLPGPSKTPRNSGVRTKGIDLDSVEVMRQHLELIVLERNGEVEKWPSGSILTYAVVRSSFASETNFMDVVEWMARATTDWESACGIRFEHRPAYDTGALHYSSGIPVEVRFVVVLDDNIRPAFATSFFPRDPQNHQLRLSSAYFTDKCYYDRVGVLRHELGHIMGFRHEHAHKDAPRACWPSEEPIAGAGLTSYDSRSVMHYLCGNVGTKELAITELDRLGAVMVYPKH